MSELDAINLAGVNKIITEEEDREFILNTEKEISEQKGIKKGIKEGIKEGILTTAKNLLKKNMSVEDISEVTNLSIDEIEALK